MPVVDQRAAELGKLDPGDMSMVCLDHGYTSAPLDVDVQRAAEHGKLDPDDTTTMFCLDHGSGLNCDLLAGP